MEIQTTMLHFEATEISIKNGNFGKVIITFKMDNRYIESLLSQLDNEEIMGYLIRNLSKK